MVHHIGDMVWKLRKEKGISQNALRRGILNRAEYSRFEEGDIELDKIHLEAIFQRLGKSEDKLERAVTMEEYQTLSIRYTILHLLSQGEVKEADEKIEEYKAYADMDKPLYRQAVMLFVALRGYTQDREKEKAVSALEQALCVTFPKWQDTGLEQVYLCTQEIQILLLLIYFRGKKMDTFLKSLFSYIDQRYTDDEERVRVYPQCAWLLGQAYFTEHNIGSAYEVCGKGIECLAKNGALSYMKELLELKEKCLECFGKEEEIIQINKQKAAIEFLYEIAEEPYVEEHSISLLQTSRETEIIVLNEVIREMRQAQKLSQEELSADICSQETLSRIESGGRSPNRKNAYAMLRRMGLNRGSYYGSIVADDYELYEKVREYKRSVGKREWETAKRLKKELEEGLDLGNPVNKQFIEICQLQEKLQGKDFDHEKGIRELKRILGYTWKDFEGNVYRVPFREEVVILSQIAFSLRMLGRMEEAINIYEQILCRYENSAVSNDFHASSCFLIYVNYTGDLEVSGNLEKAEKIGKEGISLMLKCQRGDVAGKILANVSCIYEKKVIKENIELAEKCLRNSYYLLALYQNQYYEKLLYNIYQKKYFERLD